MGNCHAHTVVVVAMAWGFDFKTTYHKNPQKLITTYCQKAPIAQYVCRIDAQIAVRLCAICSIYIISNALGDISTVSIFIGGCVFSFTKLACAAVQCGYILPQNGGTSLVNEKTHPPIKTLTVKISPRALGMM